jgi:hypothetical protein
MLDLGVKRSIEISRILQSVLPSPTTAEAEHEPPDEHDST